MKRVVFILAALVLTAPAAQALDPPPAQCDGRDTNDNRSTDVADFLSGSPDVDIVALGDGDDQYFAAEDRDRLCGNAGNDLLVGEGAADDLLGGDGADQLVGFGGADELLAGDGFDTLEGGGGDDVLRAAVQDDQRDDLFDGAGSDTIIGNNEDVWHRCPDNEPDDRDAFNGEIVLDPNC